MNSSNEVDFREYAWNYFALHAGQRLQTFEFYITLSTAILGGFFAMMQAAHASRWVSLLGFLLSFLSFVFWKLDCRTRNLIKNAEEALKALDAQHGLPRQGTVPHPLELFARDAHVSDSKPKWPLTTGHFSYSRCFEWVFIAFGIGGLVSACWAMYVLG